ncbi:MAG: hypothetical protein AAFP92_26345 [Bacteroidota bacterium]
MRLIVLWLIWIGLLLPTCLGQTPLAPFTQSEKQVSVLGTQILTPRLFQFEIGFSTYPEQFFRPGNGLVTNYRFPEINLRYGLAPHMELQVQVPFRMDRWEGEITDSVLTGLGATKLGGKFLLLKQKEIGLEWSFLAEIYFPGLGRPEFRPTNLSPALSVLMKKYIGDYFSFLGNYGLTMLDPDHLLSHYGGQARWTFQDDFSLFVEVAGQEGEEWLHRGDLGLALGWDQAHQASLAIGRSLVRGRPQSFFSLRYAYRMSGLFGQ